MKVLIHVIKFKVDKLNISYGILLKLKPLVKPTKCSLRQNFSKIGKKKNIDT